MELALVIRQIRRAKNLSQDDLAFLLRDKHGIPARQKDVSRWEIGLMSPRINVLYAIADVMGVKMDDLVMERRKRVKLSVEEQF